MSSIRIVIVNFRRPKNILKIVSAIRSYQWQCKVLLIDASENIEYAVSEAVLPLVDEYIRTPINIGPFNRYAYTNHFKETYSLFLDDDFIPGSGALDALGAWAKKIPKMGILGPRGRFVSADGRYLRADVPVTKHPAKVDVVIRAYFLHAAVLEKLHSFCYSNKIDTNFVEDDILICACLNIYGYNNYILPQSIREKDELIYKELPAPHAWWQRRHHFERRDFWCKKLVEVGWKPIRSESCTPKSHKPG